MFNRNSGSNEHDILQNQFTSYLSFAVSNARIDFSGGHNGGNGRDREDLRIHILHDLVGLFPYRCRRKGGHRVCRQHCGAEKTGKKKTPPVDMAAPLPVLRLCGFQLFFHCVPP